MDDRRRSGWNHRGRGYARPHHPAGPGHMPVPDWEKTFVTSVCRIPWRRLCETKQVMSMYKNVIEWDDSEALLSFQNAKTRFRSKFHNQYIEDALPDPDLYIDNVDDNVEVDPVLLADLEKSPPPPVSVWNASQGLDLFLCTDKPVPATGWGDEEDPLPENGQQTSDNCDKWGNKTAATGWGGEDHSTSQNAPPAEPQFNNRFGEHEANNGWEYNHGWNYDANNRWNPGASNSRPDNSGNYYTDSGNAWDSSAGWEQCDVQNNSQGGRQENSWGNERITSAGWEQCDVQNNSQGGRQENSWGNERNNSWGSWENKNNSSGRRNDRKREGGGYGYRWTRSRYPTENHQVNNNRWSDGRESNKMSHPYGNTAYDKQVLAMR